CQEDAPAAQGLTGDSRRGEDVAGLPHAGAEGEDDRRIARVEERLHFGRHRLDATLVIEGEARQAQLLGPVRLHWREPVGKQADLRLWRTEPLEEMLVNRGQP